jgi:hypothetical protein
LRAQAFSPPQVRDALSGLPERDGKVLPDRDPLALAVDGPEDDEGFGAFANPEPEGQG